MTAPRAQRDRRASTATAGVGTTPAVCARPPAAVIPSTSAASSQPPDSRVSRPISTRPPPVKRAAAAPSPRESGAVRSDPATPRTPSVPKSLGGAFMGACWRAASALGELRPLARLLQAGLLALDLTRVAGQEPLLLEVGAQPAVGLQERLRDAVAEGARLPRDAAAVDAGAHVVGA